MNHVKRLWGHYLALMILLIILAFPVNWIYRFFQNIFGKDVALFGLTVTVMLVVIFGIWGAIHTHRITSILRREIDRFNQPVPAGTKAPFIFKLFKIDWHSSPMALPEMKDDSKKTDREYIPFLSISRKRRGKQPRFSEEQIRKAVLKWESRDPSFSSRTLEEFLAQEFGCGPDGIQLMATTTFYDWRRRILKELEVRENKL